MQRCLFLMITLSLLGCESTRSASTPQTSVDHKKLPELVFTKRVWSSPSGGTDGAPRYLLSLVHSDGSTEALDIPPVTHAVQWEERVVYIDVEKRLFTYGDSEPIATQVFDTPAVSNDNNTLAYVSGSEQGAEVHFLSKGNSDIVVDRSLLSLGALRFAPDNKTVLGVGSKNNGIAGLHAVSRKGAVCLSNCNLRVGTPFSDSYVAPPGSASELTFEGDTVGYAPANAPKTTRWFRWSR